MRMDFDSFEITISVVLISIGFAMVALVAGIVGYEAWRSSGKAAAYKAYTECLHETREKPIDLQQMFCSRIRDQL